LCNDCSSSLVGAGPSGGELPVDGDGIPGLLPARPPAAPGRATGCSATLPGSGGTRPGGRRPAPSGWYGFLDRGQCVLPPPQIGQPVREVVQRGREASGWSPWFTRRLAVLEHSIEFNLTLRSRGTCVRILSWNIMLDAETTQDCGDARSWQLPWRR
jgi:hypothetical protein